ncbi:MAG: hypothetical protein CVV35_07470 [Methanomicrobiales archaeon HGW-Methanomicrobiales-6]|jgi:hypothetical protein|nr:MAG: hypothetical protein CVV35_07470 [Methanomicrobiales archaeon HGW-Methanomicrobiales-6]
MAAMGKPSVAKVIELIGSSPTGWEDAAANAVKEAAKTGELPLPEGRGFLLHGQYLHHRDVM